MCRVPFSWISNQVWAHDAFKVGLRARGCSGFRGTWSGAALCGCMLSPNSLSLSLSSSSVCMCLFGRAVLRFLGQCVLFSPYEYARSDFSNLSCLGFSSLGRRCHLSFWPSLHLSADCPQWPDPTMLDHGATSPRSVSGAGDGINLMCWLARDG